MLTALLGEMSLVWCGASGRHPFSDAVLADLRHGDDCGANVMKVGCRGHLQ